MTENKSADTLSLVKSDQRKFSKEVKKLRKKLQDGTISIKLYQVGAKQKVESKRGLLYIAHIPHGFYEKEMRDYFSQFGKVTNAKVCRSRKTGNSKGYGYVEFAHAEVAKIAADTMNNYIMFKKRIVTNYVPYEKRPKGLFPSKSSNLKHSSVKTRRGKEKHSKNRILEDSVIKQKHKTLIKKLKGKLNKLRALDIQCNVLSLGVEKQRKGKRPVTEDIQNVQEPEGQFVEVDSDVEFKIPATKKLKTSISHSQAIKERILRPSQKLLKRVLRSRDNETQPLVTKPKQKAVKDSPRGGGIKKSKRGNKVPINTEAVKRIAKGLIRQRSANSLVNLVSSKEVKNYKKSPKKKK
ncbi:MKI67 FHA domain-interacting nucleolar phosphoprotein-like [Cylas formicarius]|uniref:MKI67 FHA domain-interacting nucleolar phosphoprotein-like n=1 Tax=Cylas formicarius TaxID=197179 RepID=UPI0029587DAD|nr:MKI67 FHA domain-interacting nucleolar phosphoprotein-like [Cylas formicarius]